MKTLKIWFLGKLGGANSPKKRGHKGIGSALFIGVLVLRGYAMPVYSFVPDQEDPRSVPQTGVKDPVPGEGEILVKFKESVAASEKKQCHEGAGAEVLSVIPELGVERIRSKKGESIETLLKRYSQSPFVEYAEPNSAVEIQSTSDDAR